MKVVRSALLLSFLLCYISSLIFAFPPFNLAPAGYDYAVSGAVCFFPFHDKR